MLEISEVKPIIESLLFVADEPLTIRKFKQIIEDVDEATIKQALAELKLEYSQNGRAIQLVEIANGYQLATRPRYAEWVKKLIQSTTKFRLTKPALETLTIIAYRQPVMRAEIEAIRGVDSGGVIQTLLEKKLIRVTGRKEVVGRPLLYGTTQEFLDHFGLRNLSDLPTIEEVVPESAVGPASTETGIDLFTQTQPEAERKPDEIGNSNQPEEQTNPESAS
ncbi:MAG: SMC-Scp complex subunit ScpB [bacterium]|nr:SMC-Scp complex subunit ScpB [bacterium]